MNQSDHIWKVRRMNRESSKHNEKGLLPFEIIEAANAGDPEAIMSVLQHYEKYITMQAKREYMQPNGTSIYMVDQMIWDELVIKLIEAVLKFDLNVR